MLVTISLYQLLRYQSWYLKQNYLQYLACLKLGVNTKFVLGLPLDVQRVFEQKKIT